MVEPAAVPADLIGGSLGAVGIQIAPSILSADFARLADEVAPDRGTPTGCTST